MSDTRFMSHLVIGPPLPGEYAPYAIVYLNRVPETDILPALEAQIEESAAVLAQVTEEDSLRSYAPGKWTLRESVCHMADMERLFAYRALSIARGDKTALPGVEQDDWVPYSNANARSLTDLIAELVALRKANLFLFRGLDADAWMRTGIASDNRVSVRGLAYIILGHERHHIEIVRKHYLGAAERARA